MIPTHKFLIRLRGSLRFRTPVASTTQLCLSRTKKETLKIIFHICFQSREPGEVLMTVCGEALAKTEAWVASTTQLCLSRTVNETLKIFLSIFHSKLF
jgi:hypothetical protein